MQYSLPLRASAPCPEQARMHLGGCWCLGTPWVPGCSFCFSPSCVEPHHLLEKRAGRAGRKYRDCGGLWWDKGWVLCLTWKACSGEQQPEHICLLRCAQSQREAPTESLAPFPKITVGLSVLRLSSYCSDSPQSLVYLRFPLPSVFLSEEEYPTCGRFLKINVRLMLARD